jgi:hypothetical protein
MKRLIPFTVNRVVRHAWASMAQPLVVQPGVQARVARAMCTRRSESSLLRSANVAEPRPPNRAMSALRCVAPHVVVLFLSPPPA